MSLPGFRHSFIPYNQDFTTTEKRKRLTAAIVPSQIKDAVRSAKLQHPFKVTNSEKTDIYDFKSLASQLLSTVSLHISNVAAIQVTYASLLQNCVYRKTTYGDLEEWRKVPVSKKCVNLVRDIPTELSRNGNTPKIHAKIEDFKKMIQYLEDKYRQFYVDLC